MCRGGGPCQPLVVFDALRLYVDSVEPAAEVYLDGESLGWERVPLEPVGEDRPVDWFVWLAVPDGGFAGRQAPRRQLGTQPRCCTRPVSRWIFCAK